MLANRLKELMDYEGISQKQLADELGMNPQNISRYLSGTNPTYDFFYGMCKKGVNINWLLSGEGEMYRDPVPSTNTNEIDGDGFYKVLRAMFETFDGRYKQFLQPLMNELDRRERAQNDKKS